MRIFDSAWGPENTGYMISAYLRRIAFSLELIIGAGDANRRRLILAMMLALYPGRMRKQSGKIGEILDQAIKRLLEGVILALNGVKYSLTDEESLFILAPRNEQWMWPYLNMEKGNTFIDVGAHIGKYALWGARTVGEHGLVVALEPYEPNYDALIRGVCENGFKNLVALKCVAWNENRIIPLFLNESTGGSLKVNGGFGEVCANARTLDSIVEDLKMPRVDLIKIDVEGAEFEVLSGADHLLSRYAPRVLVEVACAAVSRVDEYMRQKGYVGKLLNETPVFLHIHYLPGSPVVSRFSSGK